MKMNYFQNSFFAKTKSSVWNTDFFPRQFIPKILFAFHFHYTGDTPYRFWFDLKTSLTRWKRPIFKIPFSRNSKVPYEILTFFLGKLYKNFFLFYTLITLVILDTRTGGTPQRVWFDLDNSSTRWKRFIFKIRNSRNSQNSVWKPNYFLRLDITQILFALLFHYTADTPYRVWFDLHNSLTRWKRPIFKIPFLRNSKVPCEKLTFSLG